MKKESLMRLLAQRVGNRQDADILAVLELELGLAQDTLLEQNGRFKPWFLTSEFATIMTKPNEQRVPIPGDFLGEVEEGNLSVLIVTSGKYVPVNRDDYDYLEEVYKDSSPGVPRHYTLDSDKYYRLFPTPDIAYTLRQRYVERDLAFELVSPDKENRWLKYASDLLLSIGGEQYALKHLQNPGLAALFTQDATRAWARLKGEHEMREHSNRLYEMGE